MKEYYQDPGYSCNAYLCNFVRNVKAAFNNSIDILAAVEVKDPIDARDTGTFIYSSACDPDLEH